MVPIKRRTFLQSIAAAAYACLGVLGGSKVADKVIEATDSHDEFLGCLKRNHTTADDICNEALEKISEEPVYPIGTRKVMPDGRVFRYVKCVDDRIKGDLYHDHGITGVVYDEKWVQTHGLCLVNTVDGDEINNTLCYLEGI